MKRFVSEASVSLPFTIRCWLVSYKFQPIHFSFSLAVETTLGIVTRVCIFLFPFSLQQGHREDLLSDTFWLMAFLGSASFIGSQVLANWLIGDNVKKRMTSPSMAAVFLALVGVICVARLWRESSQTDVFEDHGRSYFSDGKSWISPLLNSTSLLSYEKYPLFIEADISTWIHGWLIKGLK